MTPEQQRIAIAEACGWDRFCSHKVDTRTVQYGHPPNSARKYETPLPDYLNDLNAMHEAEGELNRGSGYHETGGYGLYLVALDHDVSATAAQRAEAFLRTIGKWVDQ